MRDTRDIAERVKGILRTRELTLYRVSQLSGDIFGHRSPYHIPHNFYYDISIAGTTPSIHQLLALSRISRYRLEDWLMVFGYRLDDIPRLGVLVPRRHTVELDSSVYDECAWIPWFNERKAITQIPFIAPLGGIVKMGPPKRARELLGFSRKNFLYARIGQDDLWAFPDLLPGSIVRVDKDQAVNYLNAAGSELSKRMFLVEDSFRLTCCHLRLVAKDRVILFSSHYPFGQVEVVLGRDVTIRGIVDAEIRPVSIRVVPKEKREIRRELRFRSRRLSNSPQTLSELMCMSRYRTGLSFREASMVSRWIAETLGDQLYFTAASTLSDYESLASAPRHIQKLITLCILYSIRFWDFLRAADLQLDQIGREPLPDRIMPRRNGNYRCGGPERKERPSNKLCNFLQDVISKWGELPLFLRDSLNGISDQMSLSLSDIFWVGEDQNPIHPYLINADMVVINRRNRRPPQSTANKLSEQPLYVLLKRDGTYVCGCCTLQHELLTIHPFPDRPFTLQRLRNGLDAEVVGRVTAIIRRLK